MTSFFKSVTLGLLLGTSAVQAQSIVNVNPNTGNQGQSLSVSITGQNTHFNQGSGTNAVSLFMQGSPATQINASFSSASSTTDLSAFFNIPGNATTGYYDVKVSNNPDGNLVLPHSFFISASGTVAPKLTNVSPNNANPGQQSLSVTITGQNTHFNQSSGTNTITLFRQGSPATQISAYQSSASSATILSSLFNIPANAPGGYYDVQVANSTDGNLTLPQSFFIGATSTSPKLTGIVPNNAKQGQQTFSLTITGQNTHFNLGNNTSTVTLFRQGSPVTQITAYFSNGSNANSLSAFVNIPLNVPTGYYDVQVYNSTDGNMVLPQGFLINPGPMLTAIDPKTATTGQSLYVSITGQNTHFSQSSGSNMVKLFQQGSTTNTTINASYSTDNGNTSLYSFFNIPSAAPTGSYDVVVTNSTDGSVSLPQSFFISASATNTAATITNISPAVGFQGQQSLNVTITGQNTNFTQGSSTLAASLINHNNPGTIITGLFNSASSTTTMHAIFNIPVSAPIGIYDVQVYNAVDGKMTLPLGFVVTPDRTPTITYVNPASAELGQTIAVDILGHFTTFRHGNNHVSLFKQGSPSITITGSAGNPTTDTTLIGSSFIIPTAVPTGYYDVVVTNANDGSMKIPTGFLISAPSGSSAPAIVRVTPSFADQNTNITLQIVTKNTALLQYTNSFSLTRTGSSPIPALSVYTVNDDSLTAEIRIPANATTGYWDVNITSGTTGINKVSGFRITKPVGIAEVKSATAEDHNVHFYPNPFSDGALLAYDLTETDKVEVSVYTLLGNKIQTPVNALQAPGHYEFMLSGEDMPQAGIYFISVKIGNNKATIVKAIKQ